MYGHEFSPTGNLFGLRCGQLRSGLDRMIHNSGWYNKFGEKLGFGDLAAGDFKKIARALRPRELFIILTEQRSYSDFRWPSLVDNAVAAKLDIEAPGVNYVAKHATYVIARNQVYFVDPFAEPKERIPQRRGRFRVMKPNEVKALMVKNASA